MSDLPKPLNSPHVWKFLWRVLLGAVAFRTLQSAYAWEAPWFALACVLWGAVGYAYGRFHEHYAWIRDPEEAKREGASWRSQWSKLDA